MRRLTSLAACAALLAAASCAPPPEARASLPPAPPGDAYPELLPQRELTALPDGPSDADLDANAALAARADALRRRAAGL